MWRVPEEPGSELQLRALRVSAATDSSPAACSMQQSSQAVQHMGEARAEIPQLHPPGHCGHPSIPTEGPPPRLCFLLAHPALLHPSPGWEQGLEVPGCKGSTDSVLNVGSSGMALLGAEGAMPGPRSALYMRSAAMPGRSGR